MSTIPLENRIHMAPRHFRAATLEEAFRLVRSALGHDAAVLEARRVWDGLWRGLWGFRRFEVLAARRPINPTAIRGADDDDHRSRLKASLRSRDDQDASQSAASRFMEQAANFEMTQVEATDSTIHARSALE